MKRIKTLFILILLPSVLLAQNRLYQLEKQKLDLQLRISNLINQNELLKNKITDNESAIIERKKSIAALVRLNRSLNQFNVGGIMSLENPQKLNRTLKVVEKIRDKLVTETTEFNFIQADLFNKKNILDRQISEMSEAEKLILQQEKNILSEEKKMIDQLLQTREKSLLSVKGYLLKPVQCKIDSDFGLVSDSTNKYNIFNKGTTYSCRIGDKVVSVGPGRIIFRDHVEHWGESIIIEHDGGYYSVYTHLANISKSKGDEVVRGEVLGYLDNSEFYFEFRHQNIPIFFNSWTKR